MPATSQQVRYTHHRHTGKEYNRRIYIEEAQYHIKHLANVHKSTHTFLQSDLINIVMAFVTKTQNQQNPSKNIAATKLRN